MTLWLPLWILLIVLWIGWCVQAILVVLQARKFSRRVGWSPREVFEQHHPTAAVIVPCKGHDADLTRNVRSLLTQDYPLYRVVFVFESEEDAARPLVEAELVNHSGGPRVDLVTAGLAASDTGQKVHNQLAVLRWLEQQDDRSELYVFADSDAVPGPGWLQKLAGPHAHPDRVGATTGYRWLMPELRAQRPRIASAFASVINSAVAMFIGHGDLTQAWGGSMAIRADFARRHDLVGRFRGALSDDYQLTRLCHDAGKRVYFVPQCLVASPINLGWAALFEFGRRQYLITRVHDPVLFYKALGVIGLYVIACVTAWAVLIFALCAGRWDMAILPLVAVVIVAGANQFRANYRKRAVHCAFGRDQVRYLRHTLLLDRWGTSLVMPVNLALLLSAAVGRTMTWRGIRYRLDGPQRVQRLQ